MNRTTVINSMLILTVLSLLVFLAFRVKVGATPDAVVALRTTGMTCGSCADKIKQSLSREKGVAGTDIDVTASLVLVGYDSKLVTAETLATKVSGVGFVSTVAGVMTPEQYTKLTGRQIWKSGSPAAGCGGCGQNGGCGTKN
jgi:copper chaperone CopZ